jgi:GNAT superfamily N-acetyltransferase
MVNVETLEESDVVYARTIFLNDGSLEGLPEDAVLAPEGAGGAIVRKGHLEQDPGSHGVSGAFRECGQESRSADRLLGGGIASGGDLNSPMMSNLSSCPIRFAVESDIPDLVALLQALFAIEADFQGDPAKQERGLRLLLESPGGKIWVAEEQGRIVGLCTLQVLISTAEGGPVGLIEDVVVASDRRGFGIGRQLLAALETWAVQHGLSRLQLLADRENRPALDFYRRLDWQETKLIALRKTLTAHSR